VHSGLHTARGFFTARNAETYDHVVKLATLGQDKHWKKMVLKKIHGDIILDLASGTGILSEMIRGETNALEVLALDLSLDYVKISKRKRNIEAVFNANAEMLPFRNKSCDCIVSSYLAKYVDVDKLVTEINRVLASNGVVVFHDFSYPRSKAIRIIWKFHFKLLCITGLFIKSWRHIFLELDEMIENSRWSEDLLKSLRNHDFVDICSTDYTFGTSIVITAKKK
jgi:demethylmenaquinone methyltransferase / 2-methoxy-6-polyprenyl-1,4-benzoquinol methylase